MATTIDTITAAELKRISKECRDKILLKEFEGIKKACLARAEAGACFYENTFHPALSDEDIKNLCRMLGELGFVTKCERNAMLNTEYCVEW